MSRGRDRHQAKLAAVQALGRPLNRRARSRCELCGASTSLKVVEVEGSPHDEPHEDWALMLCERCAGLHDARRLDASELRFLETAVWSELQPAQILAVRIVRKLADEGTGWASDVLEGLYLDPDLEALI